MKITSYSLLLAAAACGMALGQTAYTTPVGYETLSLVTGTNYIGLRLQQPVVAAGIVSGRTVNSFSDTSGTFVTSVNGGATTFYIVEFLNANGVIQEVTGASVTSNTTIKLVDDVTAKVPIGTSYKIRKAATLATTFGASNTAGLTAGFFGPSGADTVSIPNGLGGFEQYYYDQDQASWARVVGSTGVLVNGAAIPLIYVDGIVMGMTKPLSLTVTGELKTQVVAAKVNVGTSFLSSVFPVGATLASTFGSPATIASLDHGFFGPAGADIFQIPDGLGGFTQYYYDEDQASWAKVVGSSGVVVNANSVNLTPGFAFSNVGAAFNLLISPPTSYSGL